jgi:hypothetical protein
LFIKPGKKLENVTVETQMPKSVMNLQLTPSQGRYTFDQVKKVLFWDVGRIDQTKVPSLKGNVRLFSIFFINTVSSNSISNAQIRFR